MRAEILCVGSELLLGQIIDTNAAYIAGQLARIGIDLHRKQTAGDNLERISDCIQGALRRADVLVITGGLGPTTDDLTREAIAVALGVPLEYQENLAQNLREHFAKRNYQIGETTLRQAYLPASCIELHNPVGTAPGVQFEGEFEGIGGKWIFAVPGVPREMREMLDGGIVPILSASMGGERQIIVSRILRAFGIGESGLADQVEDILTSATNPTVAPLIFGNTEVHLRLTAKARDEAAAKILLDETENQIRARVGTFIFGSDAQTVPSVTLDLLKSRKETLGVAESLTGGVLSAFITDVAGSSVVFRGGITAYNAELKCEILGVKAESVAGKSVVSEVVAREMALGAQKITGATYALATTGEAGPESQSGAVVGTVYLALAHPGGVLVEKREFHGDRDAIRKRAALSALDLLRRFLLQS
ncbi:competence/damage-inducible protein cinA [Abditibacterium utsteinense]|uniref:CinA-like protein n=1 Tax=Abditibacterium utsteinense TaxID=1960156 RepID=A0A2S8SVC2_9BACT|nr:competence/damage-inducible protein A [Abditibacterium utsteinense]PQV64731.1 competence/damage-inducible protein cinA [Abditibacterium utsteinense]